MPVAERTWIIHTDYITIVHREMQKSFFQGTVTLPDIKQKVGKAPNKKCKAIAKRSPCTTNEKQSYHGARNPAGLPTGIPPCSTLEMYPWTRPEQTLLPAPSPATPLWQTWSKQYASTTLFVSCLLVFLLNLYNCMKPTHGIFLSASAQSQALLAVSGWPQHSLPWICFRRIGGTFLESWPSCRSEHLDLHTFLFLQERARGNKQGSNWNRGFLYRNSCFNLIQKGNTTTIQREKANYNFSTRSWEHEDSCNNS